MVVLGLEMDIYHVICDGLLGSWEEDMIGEGS